MPARADLRRVQAAYYISAWLLVAGMFAMPYWRFQAANFISAFVWAAALLTLGDVISVVIAWISVY